MENAHPALRLFRLHDAVPHAVGDIALRPAAQYEDKQDHGKVFVRTRYQTAKPTCQKKTRRAERLEGVHHVESGEVKDKAICELTKYARSRITEEALYYYIFTVFKQSWRCFLLHPGHRITSGRKHLNGQLTNTGQGLRAHCAFMDIFHLEKGVVNKRGRRGGNFTHVDGMGYVTRKFATGLS